MLKRTLAFIMAAAMLFTLTAFAQDGITVTAQDFTKTGTVNVVVEFGAADFDDHVTIEGGDSALESITITALPDSAKGELWVGGTEAAADTPITAYADLKFVPATDVTGDIKFTWKATVNTGETSENAAEVTITLAAAPAVTVEAKSFTKTGTAGQTIEFTEADFKNNFTITNDATATLESITITELPEAAKGKLWVGDTEAAKDTAITAYSTLKFVPASADITGDIKFFWKGTTSTDITSDSAEVTITLTAAPPRAAVYADMNPHWASTSATELYDLGIVVGEKIGDKRFFRPDVNITRGDFILFIAAALNIEPSSMDTPIFSDNVPNYLINISNAFHDKGIINGVAMGNNKFALNAGHTLTRMEAFKIINGALELESVKNEDLSAFKDLNAVPEWGLQPLKNLVAYKIVQGSTGGNVNPNGLISRGQAAELVYKAYMEKNKPAS